MRRILALSFAVPLALTACGGSGKTCTITTVNAQQTLVCPDGTRTTVTGASGTNGTNGTSGTTAHNTLVSVTAVAAGASCAQGGQSIETGIDANDNGTLDPSEVSSTSYVCAAMPTPETIEGDVVLVNSADIAALTGVKTITGTLTVDGSTGITSVTLPTLEHVGSLDINNGGGGGKSNSNSPQPLGFPQGTGMITSFSAPKLAIIDNEASFNDYGRIFATLDLPALVSVDSLNIYGTKLTDLSGFPNAKVASNVNLSNTSLTSLNSGATSIFVGFTGNINLNYNQSLTDGSAFAALASINTFNSYGNAFTTLSLTNLTTIGNAFYIRYASQLTSVSLPKLAQGGNFDIENNPALTTLSAPVLAPQTYVFITNNQAFSSCAAQALVDQTGHGYQYNNQSDPSCIPQN
jgi:hypothetical protein